MKIDLSLLIDAEVVSVRSTRVSVSVDVELQFGKAHYKQKINRERRKMAA